MKGLRNRFERFCYAHRFWGIPNLMVYVAVGTFIVTLLANMGYMNIYSLLSFNFTAICQGQVWRLFTYIFTLGHVNAQGSATIIFDIFSTLLLLYCFFSLGRTVERAMGTFKFNLYYLTGILLMDIFGMIFGGFGWLAIDGQMLYVEGDFSILFSGNMAFFLYLSLVICFSTLYPDAQFLVLYLIPIKAWLLTLFYFIYILYQIIASAMQIGCYPHCLFPLVAMLNYFLFFGKDVVNILPPFLQPKRVSYRGGYTTVPKAAPVKKKAAPVSYSHRCVICGRTDASNPELEFRYCSRCNGYFCYCEDHINNHTHVE